MRSAGGLVQAESVALEVRLDEGAAALDRVVVRGIVGAPRADGRRGVRVRLDPADVGRLRKAAARARPGGGRLARRQTRYDIGDLPVRCRDGVRVFMGTLRDVSDGGCYLAVRGEPPESSTHLTLEFAPPGHARAARVEGAVTWVDRGGARPGLGVRFGSGQEAAVRRFVFEVLLAD